MNPGEDSDDEARLFRQQDKMVRFAGRLTAGMARWPEQRERVQLEIVARCLHAGGRDSGASLDEALQRLESADDPAKRSPWRWIAPLIWALLFVLFLWVFAGVRIDQLIQRKGDFDPPFLVELADRREAAVVTGDLLFVSDHPLPELERRLSAAPSDPVLYQAWILARLRSGLGLPDDYDTRWCEIDPGNAYWLALKADVRGTGRGAKISEAVDLIREAAEQPRWIDRMSQIRALQRKALKAPQSLADDYAASRIMWSLLGLSREAGSDALVNEARRMAKAGENEALAGLIDSWTKVALMRLKQNDAVALPDYSTMAYTTAPGFAGLAKKQGLTDQQKTLDAISMATGTGRHMTVHSPGTVRYPSQVHPQIFWVHGDEFRDRRMAEYAKADREMATGIGGACLLFGVICRWVLLGPAGRISAACDRIFTPGDWMKILVWGLVVPVGIWLGVVYLTPFGGREWGIGEDFFRLDLWKRLILPHSVQWLAGGMMVLHALRAMVHQRLARKVGFLGMGRPKGVVDWAMAGLALALFISAPSIAWATRSTEVWISILAIFLLPGILWLIWRLFVRATECWGSILGAAFAVGRYEVPLMVLTAMLLGSVPVYRWSEARWLQNDVLNAAGPEDTRFENLATRRREEWIQKFLDEKGL